MFAGRIPWGPALMACNCKTFVGKVFVLPSNVLVCNQGVGSLSGNLRVPRATASETSFSFWTSCQSMQICWWRQTWIRNQCARAQTGKLSTLLPLALLLLAFVRERALIWVGGEIKHCQTAAWVHGVELWPRRAGITSWKETHPSLSTHCVSCTNESSFWCVLSRNFHNQSFRKSCLHLTHGETEFQWRFETCPSSHN